jgi:hypothetical protein
MVSVPVSIGELIDKLSILQVKKSKVSNENKLEFINKEYELLYDMSVEFLQRKDISEVYDDLVNTNTKLWEIEDELRVIESTKNFDDVFIELARQVYYINDDRFRLKDKINNLTNSEVREQKDYKKY